MADLPPQLRQSLTWDQGKGNGAAHRDQRRAGYAGVLQRQGAIADGDTRLAAGVLDQAQPESPDGTVPTVAACTGLALGLLDHWLAGHDTDAPAGLATMTRLPAGHWTGERAATDILTLARKG